jgi:hypothetical protein
MPKRAYRMKDRYELPTDGSRVGTYLWVVALGIAGLAATAWLAITSVWR